MCLLDVISAQVKSKGKQWLANVQFPETYLKFTLIQNCIFLLNIKLLHLLIYHLSIIHKDYSIIILEDNVFT